MDICTNFTPTMEQKTKPSTIKVLPQTVQTLNFIAAHMNVKQYEAVEKLAEKEKQKILKAITK